jgi:hypothetical protein
MWFILCWREARKQCLESGLFKMAISHGFSIAYEEGRRKRLPHVPQALSSVSMGPRPANIRESRRGARAHACRVETYLDASARRPFARAFDPALTCFLRGLLTLR